MLILEKIIEAIKKHYALDVILRSKRKTRIVFHPYHLQQVISKWHIAGWLERKKEVVSIALSSIEEVTLSDRPFKKLDMTPVSRG